METTSEFGQNLERSESPSILEEPFTTNVVSTVEFFATDQETSKTYNRTTVRATGEESTTTNGTNIVELTVAAQETSKSYYDKTTVRATREETTKERDLTTVHGLPHLQVTSIVHGRTMVQDEATVQMTATFQPTTTQGRESVFPNGGIFRLCPCTCPPHLNKTYQLQELKKSVDQIKQELPVAARNMSASVRKRISAEDSRASSAFAGVFAAILLTAVLVLLTAMDIARAGIFLWRKVFQFVNATMKT